MSIDWLGQIIHTFVSHSSYEGSCMPHAGVNVLLFKTEEWKFFVQLNLFRQTLTFKMTYKIHSLQCKCRYHILHWRLNIIAYELNGYVLRILATDRRLSTLH